MDQNLATAQTTAGESAVSGVSWAAVLAGGVASCALTLVLLAFGMGLGFTVVSPWGNSGVSATTFKIGTGLYFVVMAMISSAVGGYLAGRLRAKWTDINAHEVMFRDTAHGFLAWAAASLLGAVLLASPATALLGAGVGGAAQGAATAASAGPMDGYVDTLLRSPNAQNGNPADSRAELTRLMTSSLRNGGDLNPADRSYVASIVAARTGLSQPDAEKRVNDVITTAKSNLDAARKAAAQLAMWLTFSLLLGAFCAALAAAEGGGTRDGTWGRDAFRRAKFVQQGR